MSNKIQVKKELNKLKDSNKTLLKLIDTLSFGIFTIKDNEKFQEINQYVEKLRRKNYNDEKLVNKLNESYNLIYRFRDKEFESKRKEHARDNYLGIRPMRTFAIFFSTISFLTSLFFLSNNFTGNVIGTIVEQNSKIIGGILFVLGVLGFFISLKN